jgi:NapH/MauN family ferredoxin-type protein
MKETMKNTNKIRNLVLIFFFVLFTFFSIRHFILGGKISPSIDALCPFGGFETLFTFIATGGFVPRILISSLILAFGILITTLIFRKGFCGYICPFGTVQEFLFKITKKKIEIEYNIDKKLKYIKYLILVIILIGTYITGELIYRGFDPFVTFFHFGKGIFWDYSQDEFSEHIIPFVILIIILVFSVFINRFWCRYLCPLGAIMNLFSKFSLTKIEVNKKKCIKCGICSKVCPMKIKVAKRKKLMNLDCINCNVCISKCPKSALSTKFLNKKITENPYSFFVVLLFFLIIGISIVTGIWQSVPTTSLKDVGGNLNADNIKGWMNLEDISRETGIEVYHFIYELGLPRNIDTKISLKEISNKYNIEFETENLREFVKDFQNRNDSEKLKCPWEKINETRRECGFYIDVNKNKYCDLSE